MESAVKARLPALPATRPPPHHYQKELLKFRPSHTSLLFKTVQWLPTALGVKYLSVARKAFLHLIPPFPFSFNSHHSPTNSLWNKLLTLPETHCTESCLCASAWDALPLLVSLTDAYFPFKTQSRLPLGSPPLYPLSSQGWLRCALWGPQSELCWPPPRYPSYSSANVCLSHPLRGRKCLSPLSLWAWHQANIP